jgi:acyl carrier protein
MITSVNARVLLCPRTPPAQTTMSTQQTQQAVIEILDRTLSLKGRAAGFDLGTPLLGALPELDSMAVLSLITALEDQLGFVIHDDEIDGETFATLGSLVTFVTGKLGAT